MLRVGLTGDLGSGKSTVAALFAALGAVVFSSDEMGRRMMEPGKPVHAAIVARFGPDVLAIDGSLDRQALAKAAFGTGRIEELNAIVHPAVLAEQARQLERLARQQPQAIAVVESALIFTTRHGLGGQAWRDRFDRIVLVRAPEAVKVTRFVQRMLPVRPLSPREQAEQQAEARRRLALQSSANEAHAGECLVIDNDAGMPQLQEQVAAVWRHLQQAEAAAR